MDDLYVRLMRRLDEFPAGAMPSENLLAILRLIFDAQEAELAVELPSGLEEIGSIAARLGRDEGELETILERMADKGLVLARTKGGRRHYCLLPLVPGIFEMQFMKGETTPEKRRIAELFDAYYHEGWGEKSWSSQTALARVMMVEEEIPRGEQVLPYERVSEFIKESTYMALTTCFCRHEAELLGRSCGAPKDVCMCFGPFAEFLVERGFARKATREEVLDALDRAEKAGLVHITDNIQDKINFICNCCGCCCGFLGTITRLNIAGAVAASRYTVRVDGDLCNGCGECTEVCQVRAMSVEDGHAVVETSRCIGCGLCVGNCPSGALEVEEREGWREPAADIVELGAAVLKERGRL
ncbi:MAG: 4Fe-4S binding protein [Actinomycetota bacterium]|nr:4Fe-4S binding protein [Actinomycetota bacterium]